MTVFLKVESFYELVPLLIVMKALIVNHDAYIGRLQVPVHDATTILVSNAAY